MNENTVVLEMTISQAKAVAKATDLLARIGIGQLEILGELVRSGTLPAQRDSNEDRQVASVDACDRFDDLVHESKRVLGYSRNSSNGIAHGHVDKEVHRAWEVNAVLRQAIAVHENPNPVHKGVWHDGLRLRYTDDPVPVAKVVGQGK